MFIETVEQCAAAATALGLDDTTPQSASFSSGSLSSRPHGCYFKQSSVSLFFNPDGNRSDSDTLRTSICSLSDIQSLEALAELEDSAVATDNATASLFEYQRSGLEFRLQLQSWGELFFAGPVFLSEGGLSSDALAWVGMDDPDWVTDLASAMLEGSDGGAVITVGEVAALNLSRPLSRSDGDADSVPTALVDLAILRWNSTAAAAVGIVLDDLNAGVDVLNVTSWAASEERLDALVGNATDAPFIVAIEQYAAIIEEYGDVTTQAPVLFIARAVGNCDGYAFIETAEQCTAAAEALALNDTIPNTDANGNDNTLGTFGTGLSYRPHGCFWKESDGAVLGLDRRLYFNPNGNRNGGGSFRISICSTSVATPAPSIDSTTVPTGAPDPITSPPVAPTLPTTAPTTIVEAYGDIATTVVTTEESTVGPRTHSTSSVPPAAGTGSGDDDESGTLSITAAPTTTFPTSVTPTPAPVSSAPPSSAPSAGAIGGLGASSGGTSGTGDDTDGMSGGAVVGVLVGTILAVALVAAVISMRTQHDDRTPRSSVPNVTNSISIYTNPAYEGDAERAAKGRTDSAA